MDDSGGALTFDLSETVGDHQSQPADDVTSRHSTICEEMSRFNLKRPH